MNRADFDKMNIEVEGLLTVPPISKIQAIKLVRQMSGAFLLVSKAYVDCYDQNIKCYGKLGGVGPSGTGTMYPTRAAVEHALGGKSMSLCDEEGLDNIYNHITPVMNIPEDTACVSFSAGVDTTPTWAYGAEFSYGKVNVCARCSDKYLFTGTPTYAFHCKMCGTE